MLTFLADAAQGGPSLVLILAIGLALAFEFVNGFHDTANAVATVIYTHTLRPWIAVVWSGMWNLIGVLPASYALKMNTEPAAITAIVASSQQAAKTLGDAAHGVTLTNDQAPSELSNFLKTGDAPNDKTLGALAAKTQAIGEKLAGKNTFNDLPT